ncbi:hypothetical protein EG329_000878 [Mollisiaceae sp. DMI_Dod_QoI]|nr:hypothetical protein EG329_000878 [Helotiales sp. DMI_Dod_QoI]
MASWRHITREISRLSQSLRKPHPTDTEGLSDAYVFVEVPPYTYKPLNGKRNIRVLEVDGADSYDTTLTFKILEICLDSPPEYYAISYCWESQRPTQKVICEGQTLMVTINCEASLKQFRRRQNEKILLWIDAICINQNNEAVLERNHQVLMMGDVYRTAAQVWVWLGSDRLKPLTERIRRMVVWLGYLSKASRKSGTTPEKAKVLKIARRMKSQDLAKLSLHIPWFRRIWVLQEVILSKSALIHYDDVVIDYRELIRAVDIIARSSRRKPELLRHNSMLSFDFRILCDLESQTGILGSSSSFTQILKAGLPIQPPDYTKNIGTVYRETTKAILLYENNLDSLKRVNGLYGFSEFPSWTQNFDQHKVSLRPLPRNPSIFEASGNSNPSFWFSSDGRLLICKGKILEMVSIGCGVAFAHYSDRLWTPPHNSDWSRHLHPFKGGWLDFLKTAPKLSQSILEVWNIRVLQNFIAFVSETRHNGQTEAHAYWDLESCLCSYMASQSNQYALIGERGNWDGWRRSLMEQSAKPDLTSTSSTTNTLTPPEPKCDEQAISTADMQMSYFRSARDALRNSKISSILKTPEFRTWERISHNRSKGALHLAITHSAYYQTLFRTNLTNRLGMAPLSIREGDQIALLAGLELPMVIRPLANGHYRMIAPAYICGIMEGQAWNEEWENRYAFQDLVFE